MGYNTVAEIPGTDLKDEIVMLGGHMDSWHSGTGATDNGAGVSVGWKPCALSGAGTKAAPHDSHCLVERRRAGITKVACLRRRALWQDGNTRRAGGRRQRQW